MVEGIALSVDVNGVYLTRACMLKRWCGLRNIRANWT
jgi:hypothetical protein